MPLSSMTGYASASGSHERLHWQWEIRSVNGKGLDVRLRLAPGFEALEVAVRDAVQRHLKRGNLQITLTCGRGSSDQHLVVNEEVLEQALSLAERLWQRLGGDPPRAESILALRGVLDIAAPEDSEETVALRDGAMLRSLNEALSALVASRRGEGMRLAAVVADKIDRIESLTIAARDSPARAVEAIRTRLAEQVARLVQASTSLDQDRLHQEAALLAARADIQEEIDRLLAHVEAARKLLDTTEPVGRQFDFLAQEFNREANTLCSKAPDRTLTAIGLELKTVIDQLREQVQNIE
jgi:uncharacterized protein (TIGR00255 family)